MWDILPVNWSCSSPAVMLEVQRWRQMIMMDSMTAISCLPKFKAGCISTKGPSRKRARKALCSMPWFNHHGSLPSDICRVLLAGQVSLELGSIVMATVWKQLKSNYIRPSGATRMLSVLQPGPSSWKSSFSLFRYAHIHSQCSSIYHRHFYSNTRNNLIIHLIGAFILEYLLCPRLYASPNLQRDEFGTVPAFKDISVK